MTFDSKLLHVDIRSEIRSTHERVEGLDLFQGNMAIELRDSEVANESRCAQEGKYFHSD